MPIYQDNNLSTIIIELQSSKRVVTLYFKWRQTCARVWDYDSCDKRVCGQWHNCYVISLIINYYYYLHLLLFYIVFWPLPWENLRLNRCHLCMMSSGWSLNTAFFPWVYTCTLLYHRVLQTIIKINKQFCVYINAFLILYVLFQWIYDDQTSPIIVGHIFFWAPFFNKSFLV